MKIYNHIFIVLIYSTSIFLSCKTTDSSSQQESIYFYVGTNTGNPAEGIYSYKMDLQSGKSELVNNYPNFLNPGYLTLTKDGSKLYAVHNMKDMKESAVSAFEINKMNGALKFINTKTTNGFGGCYVSTDYSGDVLVAHYSSGSVALLPTSQNGTLGLPTSTNQHKGSSVNKDRQEGPHAHFIQEGTGGLIYAVDLGIDKIMLYNKVNDQLVLNDPPSIEMQPGAGPRHLDFHPNEKFVFVLNELEGSVTSLRYNGNDKKFTTLQTITTLPNDFKGFNKSADIHIHPSGKYLYASNRGDLNSIAVYNIDQITGRLTLIEIETEAIAWPRNFAISPNGEYLLCANRDNNSISFYRINESNGSLVFTGQTVNTPKPICIKFSKQ